ncbi:MAG TPA: J domain-containing protein [Candidatus Nanopelagicales bacterium]|nr:J domain-containing protein [Candidatus Nanopelagicales bacterium]
MVRRDPYAVLGLAPGASATVIKAAWRRLARQHHPDLAGNTAERRAATRRMAEINAAYADLRGGGTPAPGRRHGGFPGSGDPFDDARGGMDGAADARPSGPPPPPRTRPVTARFDTSGLLHHRNATTTPRGEGYRHHPRGRRPPQARPTTPEPPRASDPTGPLERLRARRARRRPLPPLDVARAMSLGFGKFHGRTLGEIEDVEPTYVSWLARAITRDPDLLDAARVVAAARTPEAED